MVAGERPTDERSATAKAELEAIVARRPDLKGESLEAHKADYETRDADVP
jgi:hypothetical protein